MSHYLVNMEQLNPSKYKSEIRQGINVLNSLFLDDKLRYFSTPIKDFFDNHLQFTAYMQAIQPNKPMDFKTIRHKIIKNKIYNSSEDIYNDISLVFDNAKKYNKKHTQNYNEAIRLYKIFKCLKKQKVLKPLIQFIPAQDINGITRICPLCNNILLATRNASKSSYDSLLYNKCIQCENIIKGTKIFHCHNHSNTDNNPHFFCKKCVIPFCKSCCLWHHRNHCPFYLNSHQTDNSASNSNDDHEYEDDGGEDEEDDNDDENEEEASIYNAGSNEHEVDTKFIINNINNNNTNNLSPLHQQHRDDIDESYQSVSSSTTATSLSLRRRKRIRTRTTKPSSKMKVRDRNYYETAGQKRKRPHFNENEFSDATTNSSTSNMYHNHHHMNIPNAMNHTQNHPNHHNHGLVQHPLPLPTLPQFSTTPRHNHGHQQHHQHQQPLPVPMPSIPMPPIIAMPPAKRHKSNNYVMTSPHPHPPPPPPPQRPHAQYQQPAEIPSPGASPSAQPRQQSQSQQQSPLSHHSIENVSAIRAIITEPPKPSLDRDKVLTFMKQQDFFQNKSNSNGADIEQINKMENKWFNGTTNNDNYATSICTFIIHESIKLIYNELQESDESNCDYGAILNKYISAGNNMSQLIQEKKHELYDFVGYHLERFKPNNQRRQRQLQQQTIDAVDLIDDDEENEDGNNNDNAQNWNHQQFIEWVINIKNGRFKQYRKIFEEQEICGYHLAEIEPNDLVEMGIKKVLDKKLLFSLIQDLIQN